MTPEQQDARADYDAACARRERLIDEADALCGELEALVDAAAADGNQRMFERLRALWERAEVRYVRRITADVEF